MTFAAAVEPSGAKDPFAMCTVSVVEAAFRMEGLVMRAPFVMEPTAMGQAATGETAAELGAVIMFIAVHVMRLAHLRVVMAVPVGVVMAVVMVVMRMSVELIVIIKGIFRDGARRKGPHDRRASVTFAALIFRKIGSFAFADGGHHAALMPEAIGLGVRTDLLRENRRAK